MYIYADRNVIMCRIQLFTYSLVILFAQSWCKHINICMCLSGWGRYGQGRGGRLEIWKES